MTVVAAAPRVLSVQAGRVAPLGPAGVPSAFVKSAVTGAMRVEALGLVGDEQADLTVHGGPEKAVYAYAAAHYATWSAEYPQHAARFVPGGLGENLTIAGLDESDLCIGDVHAIGSVRLQVCQPRQPCFKFALRFGDKHLPKAMVRNGRSGWYYRVLEPGWLVAGDAVKIVERPNPAFGFNRLLALMYAAEATRSELEAMAQMQGLASEWREAAKARLGMR